MTVTLSFCRSRWAASILHSAIRTFAERCRGGVWMESVCVGGGGGVGYHLSRLSRLALSVEAVIALVSIHSAEKRCIRWIWFDFFAVIILWKQGVQINTRGDGVASLPRTNSTRMSLLKKPLMFNSDCQIYKGTFWDCCWMRSNLLWAQQ